MSSTLSNLQQWSQGQRSDLARSLTPRIVEPYIPHVPHPTQSAFLLLSHVKEVFYGGAAGGGKSDALIMAALQYVDVPDYSALLLRKRYSDLAQPGAIMDRTQSWLKQTDATQTAVAGKSWRFPSGARLTFGYVQYARDVEQFRSAEYQFIGFDELTQHPEATYEFLFSRLRRPAHSFEPKSNDSLCVYCDRPEAAMAHEDPPDNLRASILDGKTTVAHVPLRMRSASNPGGEGHSWVKKRFVDPKTRQKGAVFVPANLNDNPSLDRESYAENLGEHLGATLRARLLRGDWDIVDTGMFKSHWFQIVEEVPADCRWVRYWDLASSPTPGSDWTRGALLGLSKEGVWYLSDMAGIRGTPYEVEQLIGQTATLDGRAVEVAMERHRKQYEGIMIALSKIWHARQEIGEC